MNKKITLGIIGCGMVGGYHIAHFLKIEGADVKCVCDLSQRALKKILIKYPHLKGTTNYSEILEDPSVYAVVICTPPHTHCKIARDALIAKKHILLEKPIAINQAELDILSQHISTSPDCFILDCSARHSRLQPKFSCLKNIIESGKLGQIYSIHHNAVTRTSRPGIEYHPEAKWFLNKKLAGGGPLIDWGVYDLSFHLGLLNDRPQLKSIKKLNINGLDKHMQNNIEYNVEEHSIIFMEFDNGLTYYWERAANAHNEAVNETRLCGTKGGLKFSYLTWDHNKIVYFYLSSEDKPQKDIIQVDMGSHSSSNEDYYAMDLHFIRCLMKQEEPILPFSIAKKNLEIIFNCLSETEIKLAVPPHCSKDENL